MWLSKKVALLTDPWVILGLGGLVGGRRWPDDGAELTDPRTWPASLRVSDVVPLTAP